MILATNETAASLVRAGTLADFSAVTDFRLFDSPGGQVLPELPACTHFHVGNCVDLILIPDLPAVQMCRIYGLPLLSSLPPMPFCTFLEILDCPRIKSLPRVHATCKISAPALVKASTMATLIGRQCFFNGELCRVLSHDLKAETLVIVTSEGRRLTVDAYAVVLENERKRRRNAEEIPHE